MDTFLHLNLLIQITLRLTLLAVINHFTLYYYMVMILLISYFIFVGVRPNFTLFYLISSHLIIILNLT